MAGEHDAGAAADPGEPAAGEDEAGDAPEAPAIDLAALAERVYRLMCREVRLERARGVSLFAGRTE